MTGTAIRPAPIFGWAGFLAGAAALLIAMTVFLNGPFAPQSASVAPAEGALERAASAVRATLGREAAVEDAPASPAPDPGIGGLLIAGVPVLGGLAVVLGLAAFIRHEPRRPAISAITLGGSAIVFQLVTGFVLILTCLVIVGAFARDGDSAGGILSGILEAIGAFFRAIGDFFSNIFGGFFGN